jgi:glutathione S-transferase
MLEEIGEPYQLVEKSTRTDELQSTEYVRLNPNARIPTLVDGDFVLWESMAINLYLAQKYAGPMHCADPKVLGLAAQWSFWAMLEMEALLLELLNHRAVLPEFARDASYVERDELLLRKPLGVLNNALTGHDHLADHLCLNRNRLRVLGCDPLCLVTSRRRLRHQRLVTLMLRTAANARSRRKLT